MCRMPGRQLRYGAICSLYPIIFTNRLSIVQEKCRKSAADWLVQITPHMGLGLLARACVCSPLCFPPGVSFSARMALVAFLIAADPLPSLEVRKFPLAAQVRA
ncbi:hypothetical protein [Dictyobacter alpinus]|uniref:hypothetical protein n=1 Tax=Dictyobacter alpinus TaxID=2014873 RepID=UPI000F81ABFF|nr:hypothetical protein [Dictyobacter alpinus]